VKAYANLIARFHPQLLPDLPRPDTPADAEKGDI
jgi:hypothetical protein